MDKTEMINQNEAASIMGVSVTTLRRRLADGTLILPTQPTNPLLKRPRKILYDKAIIERLAQPRTEG